MSTGRFKIQLKIGELCLTSGVSAISLGNSYNVYDPVIYGYVSLPKNPEFWPNLVIYHVDTFGKNKNEILGTATISKPQNLLVGSSMNIYATHDSEISGKLFKTKQAKDSTYASNFNWWTKYYASITNEYNPHPKHTLIIYDEELENQPEFNGFQDWAQTIPISKGYNENKKGLIRNKFYCVLKAQINFEDEDKKNNDNISPINGLSFDCGSEM